MTKQYAKGRNAVAECQRSGQKMRYRDLVEDGHVPGLLVHPDWWEPKHPQEIPPDMTDPVALYRPAPEISVPEGSGNPEAPLPIPNLPQGQFVTTLAQLPNQGDTRIVINDAQTYIIGQWVGIAIQGGYFISRITTTTDVPTFVIPFTTGFAGTVTGGEQVWIFD